MDRKIFDALRGIVYDKSGISLGESKTSLVSARVGKRMRALGLDDYDLYLRRLMEDETGEELVHLLDAISTNVTKFFREQRHFEVLKNLLNTWKQEGRKQVRIWSAACSSGEEPYTMAMVAAQALGNAGIDLRILATDISTRMLAACHAGVYGEARMADVPVELRKRYFARQAVDGGVEYQIEDRLRQMVAFRRLNLSRPPFPMRGPFDVVFCRNVMIYFDNTVRKRLVDDIGRLLRPGGHLMVGHAESLTGLMSNLKVVEPSIYVKQ